VRHSGLALVATRQDGRLLLSHPLPSDDPSVLLSDHLRGLYEVAPKDMTWRVVHEGDVTEPDTPAEREEA
jgi:hypothetical protein